MLRLTIIANCSNEGCSLEKELLYQRFYFAFIRKKSQ